MQKGKSKAKAKEDEEDDSDVDDRLYCICKELYDPEVRCLATGLAFSRTDCSLCARRG